jgi:hypothetical protein
LECKERGVVIMESRKQWERNVLDEDLFFTKSTVSRGVAFLVLVWRCSLP